MTTIDIQWKHIVQIWRTYIWMTIVVCAANLVVGGLIGVVVGVVGSIASISHEIVRYTAMTLGATIGLCSTLLPIKWLLGRDFGDFRLVLISNDGDKIQRSR